MKKSVLLLSFVLICSLCYGQSAYKPIAPKYPGSVEWGRSGEGYYLTKDSYESVKRFYVNDKGQPKEETSEENNAKHAYFVYYTSPEDSKMDSYTLGVNISTNSGSERAIDYVFEKLQEGLLKQLITQAEYDELQRRYGYLKTRYYLYDSEARASVAMAIYRKYDKKIKENIEGQGRNLEEMSMQVQKLFAEGKMHEAAELMKQMHSATGNLAADMTSGEEYDEWKKCLEEIEKNSYQVKIHIMDASNI